MAANAHYFEGLENDEFPDNPEGIQNNAFMFNRINLDPIQGAIRNVNLDFHFPDFEHFAYKGKTTKQIWEKLATEDQLPPEDYFYSKVGPAYFQTPQISPTNVKDLRWGYWSFCVPLPQKTEFTR